MRSEHGKASLARRDFIAAGLASLGWLAAGNAKAAAAASPYDPPAQPDPRSAVNALVFDVFGTVVDWRGSIIREGELRRHCGLRRHRLHGSRHTARRVAPISGQRKKA